jgi:transcriptional regulator with XRE-family HTH domain
VGSVGSVIWDTGQAAGVAGVVALVGMGEPTAGKRILQAIEEVMARPERQAVKRMLRANPRKAKNRQGALATGLYPEVSRTKLAEELGKDVSTVTGYLQGRTPPGLDDAAKIARLCGATLHELNWALAERQVEYAKAKVGRVREKAARAKRRAGI